MGYDRSLTSEIIARAESFSGIKAGIVRLENVLKGPSYQATPEGPGSTMNLDDALSVGWLPNAGSVLVLGMMHSAKDPQLDWFESGDTPGNRYLREISDKLKDWLREKHDIKAQPLPYHVERGGLFLKDAAVLSGLGIIGRNNLLIHPAWGPRIRFRSILIAGDLKATPALEGFSPCETCKGYCYKACPVKAFPEGKFRRPICREHVNAGVEYKVPDEATNETGKRYFVIKYCRACEWVCPVGRKV